MTKGSVIKFIDNRIFFIEHLIKALNDDNFSLEKSEYNYRMKELEYIKSCILDDDYKEYFG